MEFSVIFALLYMMYPGASSSSSSSMMRNDINWAEKFKETKDESRALVSMDQAMEKKIAESMRRSEITMMRSHRKATYITIEQELHLGHQDGSVNIQKLDLLDRLRRIAAQYPWVGLRKLIVVWKTGVSNNVKWDVKMSFVDRRDYNDETRELFMMEFPVSDNFIMMMSPGYTAYMAPNKGLLPWQFTFVFPEGEFTRSTKFGTLKLKLEIDQFREATDMDEIPPMVRFTRVQKQADEPTIRWMSKGKWYESSATNPEPKNLEIIEDVHEDARMKFNKFFSFLGFDVTKLEKSGVFHVISQKVDSEDMKLFESHPIIMAKSYNAYQEKYKEIVRRSLASSVYVN